MEPVKSNVYSHLPQGGLTHPSGGNSSVPRPAEALPSGTGGNGGEPSHHSGLRGAQPSQPLVSVEGQSSTSLSSQLANISIQGDRSQPRTAIRNRTALRCVKCNLFVNKSKDILVSTWEHRLTEELLNYFNEHLSLIHI